MKTKADNRMPTNLYLAEGGDVVRTVEQIRDEDSDGMGIRTL